MLITLFIFMMMVIFIRLFFFAMSAAWGLTKLILTFVLAPLVLIIMVFEGLIYLAFPVLLVIGIYSLCSHCFA